MRNHEQALGCMSIVRTDARTIARDGRRREPTALRLTFLILTAALSCSPVSYEALGSGPEAYLVEGVVKFDSLSQPPTNQPGMKPALPARWQVPFKAQVHGDRWRIDLPACDRHPDDSSIYFFDGKATYALNSFPAAIEKRRRSGEKVADNVAHARIYNLPFPRDMNALEASLVWLAYCSGYEFSKAAPTHFVPIFAYGAGIQVFDETTPMEPQEAYWELTKGVPRVPVSLVTILTLPDWLDAKIKGGEIGRPRAPLTNVVYAVNSFTNTGSWDIPVLASATMFKADVTSGAMDSRPKLIMQLVATSISTGAAPDLSGPPHLPGPTTMADKRFAVGGVTFANQLHWAGESETTNSTQYQRRKLHATEKPQTHVALTSVRYSIIGAMLTMTLVAAYVILKEKKSK